MGVSWYYDGSDFHMKKEHFSTVAKEMEEFYRRQGYKNHWIPDTRPIETYYGDGGLPDDPHAWKMVWGFASQELKPCFDEEGNVNDLIFDGSKLSSELMDFMRHIAKFVVAGSTLDFEAADEGTHFRWFFNGDIMIEKSGKIVYE